MTDLQRKLYSPNSKVSSRASTRPSSRAGFHEESNDPSNELLNDINFGNLDELISQRLNTLLNLDDSTQTDSDKQNVRLKLNSIPEIIKTLNKSRSEVSSNDRELLLNQLYNLIIKKPDLENIYDDYDYESDLLSLLKIFQSSKTSNELTLSNRALTSFIIVNVENAGVLYSEDKSLNVFSILEKKIIDTSIPVEARQYLIYSYSAIALVVYDETGGFGVDSMLEILNETLIGVLNDDINDSIPLIVAILYGIGSLLTVLVENSNLNELIETTIETTVDLFLTVENLEILKPLAMLLGLSYEIYQYDDEDLDVDLNDFDADQDILPYSNTYELTTRLEELIKSSSKKISKKNKKEGRSLFKDVLNTIIFYSVKQNRINKILSKKDESQNEDELTLSHIKLSKSRSLAVKSWFAFFRLIQLKWVFSSGIHTQLANNSQISNVVRDKPANNYQDQFKARDDSNEQEHYWEDQHQNRAVTKKKQKDVETQRFEKLNVSLNQAGVFDKNAD